MECTYNFSYFLEHSCFFLHKNFVFLVVVDYNVAYVFFMIFLFFSMF
jgi:hypothetical protein